MLPQPFTLVFVASVLCGCIISGAVVDWLFAKAVYKLRRARRK